MKKGHLLRTSGLQSAAIFLIAATGLPAAAYASAGADEHVTAEQPEGKLQDEAGVAPGNSGQAGTGSPQEDSQNVITVTGTRIRRPNFESFEPTVTVDEQFIDSRNLTNAADALNEQPAFRLSVTPTNDSQSGMGQGVNFVNAFGLGTNRTLTLINGRRVVSSNLPSTVGPASAGTQVDLNIIPTVLIDRIDFVSIGGAPVYGSDAIAGTVNVILKDRFQGIELNALSGITEQGDNFRYSLSGIAGLNFADGRGNVTVALSHDNVQGVLQTNRDFLRKGVDYFPNPCSTCVSPGRTPQNDLRVNPNVGFDNGPSDGNPSSVLAYRRYIPDISRAGVLDFTGLQFAPNGEIIPVDFGYAFAPGFPFAAGGSGGFLFEEFRQITSNVRRTNVNLMARYDVTDNVTAFFEGSYYNSRTDELIELPYINLVFFGEGLRFNVDNPFLSATARSKLISQGITEFGFSKMLTELGDQTGYSDTNLFRGAVGLRGDFEVAGRSFNWEISASHGRNKIDDFAEDIDNQNFSNAINVKRNSAGTIVCDPNPVLNASPSVYPAPVADAQCVPLNLFGEGTVTQAAHDYLVRNVHTESLLEQTVFNANLGGSLFDLWAGPVSFNLGFEHREEKARTRPDAFRQQGLGRYQPVPEISGSYRVDEAFGEVLLPLVRPESNFSLVHRAEVFARGRYVQNSLAGGFFAWSAGGSFAPVPDLEFRGNYTRSFRAPAIRELFAPVTNTLAKVSDICANPNTGPVPEIRAKNCDAFLDKYPNGTPLLASQLSVAARTGGNTDLRNERANSFTYGVIVRPTFLPKFSASLDYVNVEISDPITSLSLSTIAQACFDNPEFDASDPANGNQFCSLIPRDANGQVPNNPQNPVVFGLVNGKRIKFSGLQGSVNYSLPASAVGLSGRLHLGLDMLHVRRRIVDTTGIAPRRSDGELGDPKWSGQLRLSYVERSWGFDTSINYIGEQLQSRDDQTRDSFEIPVLDDFVLVNAGIHFDPTEELRLNFTVTNLFNRYGQRYYGIIVPESFQYGAGGDLLGRRFAASARLRF